MNKFAMHEPLRLAFYEPEFTINRKKNRVRCHIEFGLRGNPKMIKALEFFRTLTNDPIEMSMTVEAKPSHGDEFNVDVGMKVARAKAEKLAYRRMAKFFQRFEDWSHSNLFITGGFQALAAQVINHNDEYLQTF